MQYKNLNELNAAFLDGGFKLKSDIVVNNIPYSVLYSSKIELFEILTTDKKPFVLYGTSNEYVDKLEEAGLSDLLIFAWGRDGLELLPLGVRPVKMENIKNEITENEQHNTNDNVIGSELDVKIVNLPNSPVINAKIDTGAAMCCLHATKWKITDANVSFISPNVSKNVITVPLLSQQAIKTADNGVEYRPVISLNIKIGEKVYSNVKFNLNNRSSMDHEILIGQNLLSMGNFLIDPKKSIDFSECDVYDIDINKLFEGVPNKAQQLDEALEVLTNLNASFKDIVKHINAKTLSKFDSITY